MADQRTVMDTLNRHQTKRGFLKSLGGLTLGSIALTQSALAERNEVDDDDRKEFINSIRNSDQYAAIEDYLVDAGFLPKWKEAAVYDVTEDEGISDESGRLAVIETESMIDDDPIDVTLTAFETDNDLQLKAAASYDGMTMGQVYTNADIVEESGFTHTFPDTKSDTPKFSPMMEPDDLPRTNTFPSFPSIPSWITDPLPGFSDIRDAVESMVSRGRDLISEGADQFHNFADWVQDEAAPYVDEAWEFGEKIWDFGDTVLNPELTQDPPEDLEDAMASEGFEHVATLNMRNSCFLIGGLTVTAGAAISITGIGAPAGGVLMAIGGAITSACLFYQMVRTYLDDKGTCDPQYVYFFKNEDFSETVGGESFDSMISVQVPCE